MQSSIIATQEHIDAVIGNIETIKTALIARQATHDLSKLSAPEVELFDIYTPKLAGCTYGSDEYKRYLVELKPALEHHYANNRHHPEHFSNGISGMTLVDIIEMFCDWCAAVKRHDDGDIYRSIWINQKRFGYSDELRSIFENTARVYM